MATQWFYKLMGDEVGPCSTREFMEKAANGVVRPDSLVRKDVDGQWVSAWRVKGLFDNKSDAAKPTAEVEPPKPEVVAIPCPPPRQSPIVQHQSPLVNAQHMVETTPQAQPLTATNPTLPPRIKPYGKWMFVLVAFILLVPGYSWVHNIKLRDKLQSCESYGIVQADVYYQGMLSSNVVVFNLKDGGTSTARRIDPVHLLFQFSNKLDLYSVNRIVLARNGREVFKIMSSDLRPLADSYAGGGSHLGFQSFARKRSHNDRYARL